MQTLQGLLKSKTFWFNIVTMGATLLAGDTLKDIIDPATLVVLQGVANIALRIVTKTAVADK